jgi:putative acetyltransferase
VLIRDYQPGDVASIAQRFYETVRSVNKQHYSEEQVRAWAPKIPDTRIWHARMSGHCTLVAEDSGNIVGFAELERDGHIDMFYCRNDMIGRGVGRSLYEALESKAVDMKLQRIFADVSITARPFFEHCGFFFVREQILARAGVELSNFRMEKLLPLTV